MNPKQTQILVVVLCLAAIVALGFAVNLRWLSWDLALWPGMAAVFFAWRALQQLQAGGPPRA